MQLDTKLSHVNAWKNFIRSLILSCRKVRNYSRIIWKKLGEGFNTMKFSDYMSTFGTNALSKCMPVV